MSASSSTEIYINKLLLTYFAAYVSKSSAFSVIVGSNFVILICRASEGLFSLPAT